MNKANTTVSPNQEHLLILPRPPDRTSTREGSSTPALSDDVIKRAIDLTSATLGLVLLAPIFATIAVLIKVQDGGPVFYLGTRVGKNGRLFQLYRFRTMVVDADRMGSGVTAAGDQRITRLGRWLRRAKLDELPQLINVLLGHMSLVGPRPEDPRYVSLYTQEELQVLSVRPGITSTASLVFRHEEQLLSGDDWESVYRYVVMPSKLRADLNYLSRRNNWSDMKLIFRTIAAVFR